MGVGNIADILEDFWWSSRRPYCRIETTPMFKNLNGLDTPREMLSGHSTNKIIISN